MSHTKIKHIFICVPTQPKVAHLGNYNGDGEFEISVTIICKQSGI